MKLGLNYYDIFHIKNWKILISVIEFIGNKIFEKEKNTNLFFKINKSLLGKGFFFIKMIKGLINSTRL